MARPKRNTTSVTKSSDDDCVILRGVSVPLISDLGGAFITDCSRNRERLLNDNQMQEKYSLSPDYWNGLAQNKTLRLKINAEHERRVRNGTAAQESALKFLLTLPKCSVQFSRTNLQVRDTGLKQRVNCEQPQTPVPKAPPAQRDS